MVNISKSYRKNTTIFDEFQWLLVMEIQIPCIPWSLPSRHNRCRYDALFSLQFRSSDAANTSIYYIDKTSQGNVDTRCNIAMSLQRNIVTLNSRLKATLQRRSVLVEILS